MHVRYDLCFRHLINYSKHLGSQNSFDTQQKQRRPVSITTVLLVLFIALDIGVYIYVGYLFRLTLSFQEIETLEYRNPYVNLAELYSQKNSTTRYKPIVNTPRLAVQINRSHPNRVYDSRHHIYEPEFGTISPADKLLKVNPDVRLINLHVL